MPYSIASLDKERKNDLVFILGYFLYLYVKPQPHFKAHGDILKTIMSTIDKT